MSEFITSNMLPADTVKELKARARGYDADLSSGKTPEHLDKLDSSAWRADGAESFFVARQLEALRPGIYAVQYPALKAQRLIPWNMSIDPGAAQYTATVVDSVGIVSVTRDMPDDVPMVDVKTNQVSTNFFHLMLGYSYSIQEARSAMMAKVPLIPQKALRCREQMERKLDDIALLGDGTSASNPMGTGMLGLLSQPITGGGAVSTYTVPATGTGGTTTWSTKSSDDVLLDLNGAPNQVIKNTKEIEVPNTCVMPISLKTQLSNRRVGDGTSLTILKYYLENQEFIKEVESTYKAELAGDSDSDNDGDATRVVWYVKDPTRLEMLVSQPFEQLPPEARGTKVITLCHMRTAGLVVWLPSSMIYADNV